MSGGVDSSVVAAHARARGLRRRRPDDAALRSRRRGPSQGRLLRRPGHPRRARRRRPARRAALRARLRGALSRESDRAVRPRLCRRRDADPLRRLQPAHEVRRPVRGRRRSRRRRAGDRPLCRQPRRRRRAAARSTAPPIPTATRAISCSPPRASNCAGCASRSGGLPKPEVRALAREFGLGVADKADSQDICFVPTGHYSEMIERLMPGAAEPGDIVHVDGRVLGRHDGILHYTIGQRRGLGVAAGEPLYVVALDAARARVIVGPREALATPFVQLRDFNWIGPGRLEDIAAQGAEGRRARALDAAADAGAAVRRRPCRVRRAGVRRLAGPGLRALRHRPIPHARVLGGGFIAARRRPDEGGRDGGVRRRGDVRSRRAEAAAHVIGRERRRALRARTRRAHRTVPERDRAAGGGRGRARGDAAGRGRFLQDLRRRISGQSL